MEELRILKGPSSKAVMESLHKTIGIGKAKVLATGARDEVSFTLISSKGEKVTYIGHVTGVKAANKKIVDPEGTAVINVEGVFHEMDKPWPKRHITFTEYDTRKDKRAVGHIRIDKTHIHPISHKKAKAKHDSSPKSSAKRWRKKRPQEED